MELVREVDEWLSEFRCVFRRNVPFGWFVLCIWAFLLHYDGAGATSIIRYFGLAPSDYRGLLHFFHSSAWCTQALCARWVELLRLRAPLILLSGRPVYVVDGLVSAKAGKKMPGVKKLHQSSENNNKAEFVMGHFWGALSVLAQSGARLFAVPMRLALQDGIKFSPSEKATIITRMHEMVTETAVVPGTVLGDCQYACHPMFGALLKAGFHFIGRVRANTVARTVATPCVQRKRGRPRKYGDKVKLQSLFERHELFRQTRADIYGNEQQVLLYDAIMYWGKQLVKFVLSIDEQGRKAIFLSTDTQLSAEAIVTAYGWRFKIEVSFKALVERVFAFSYRFWMKTMRKRKHGDGNLYLHRAAQGFKDGVALKLEAYQRFVNLAAISLGLLQMLSLKHAEQVWAKLPFWFRTLRKEVGPSENIVRATLMAVMGQISDTSDHGSLLKKILATHTKLELPSHPLKLTG